MLEFSLVEKYYSDDCDCNSIVYVDNLKEGVFAKLIYEQNAVVNEIGSAGAKVTSVIFQAEGVNNLSPPDILDISSTIYGILPSLRSYSKVKFDKLSFIYKESKRKSVLRKLYNELSLTQNQDHNSP